MKRIFKNWNFIRLLRLAMGLAIIYQGIISRQWIFVFLGGVFTLLPIVNIGCGGTNSCDLDRENNKKNC